MATKTATPAKLDTTMRIVILRGPDRYLRDARTRELLEALRAAHGELEEFVFDGSSTEPAVVLDELRSFGLLQTHKVVILDQADQFLATRESDRGAGRGRRSPRELVERYAESPVESATLILRADTWRPGRLDKVVGKIGAIVKCEAPDARSAASWCVGRAPKAYGSEITPEAATLLLDRIGTELARLDTELAKLAAYVGEGGRIDADAVRTLVGLTREEQAWSIQEALLRGSAPLAVASLRELLEVSRQPEQLVHWAMTDLLRKLHASARLKEQGMPAAQIAREVQLWGAAKGAILGASARIPSARFAHLLRRSIEADAGAKRGLGKPARTLEALALEIADTMGRT